MPASNRAVTGPHAREVIRRYFKTSAKPTAAELLYLLDQEHLIVVQRGYEAPARRGNDDALGPLIGKSHTASLIGGGH